MKGCLTNSVTLCLPQFLIKYEKKTSQNCCQNCYTGHSSYGRSLSIGSFWNQTQPLKHKQIIEPARNVSSFSNYVPLKSQGAFDLDFKALLGCCPGVNTTTFILSVNLILFSSTSYFTASIPANRLLTLIYSFLFS